MSIDISPKQLLQDSAPIPRIARRRDRSGQRIFICYRRNDTAGYAETVYEFLSKRLGNSRVFIDKKSISTGEDYVREIERELQSTDIVLVMIGEWWASEENLTRLREETDLLRREIITALERRARVIPVFVGRAGTPSEDDLPAEIVPLLRRQGVYLGGVSEEQLYGLLRAVAQQNIGVLTVGFSFALTGLAVALITNAFWYSTRYTQTGVVLEDGKPYYEPLSNWISSPVSAFLFNFPILLTAAILAMRDRRWPVDRLLFAALVGALGPAISALVSVAIWDVIGHPPDWVGFAIGAVEHALRFGLMTLFVLLVLRSGTQIEEISIRLIIRTVCWVFFISLLAGLIWRVNTHYYFWAYLSPIGVYWPRETLNYPCILIAVLIGLRKALSLTWHNIWIIGSYMLLGSYFADFAINNVDTILDHSNNVVRSIMRNTLLLGFLGIGFAFGLRRIKASNPDDRLDQMLSQRRSV